MKVAALLILFWVSFLFLLLRLRRGWRNWQDFVVVFGIGAFIGVTDGILNPEPLRMFGLGLSTGLAASSILWALGPGTLPGPVAILNGWELFEASREVWSKGKWLLILALVLSLASSTLWITRSLSAPMRLTFTAASVAATIGGFEAWRRTLRAARSS